MLKTAFIATCLAFSAAAAAYRWVNKGLDEIRF